MSEPTTAAPTTVKVRGFGTIRKRSDSSCWWIRYTHNGRRLEESSKSDNLKVAERLLRQRVQECGKSKRIDPTSESRVTMAELFDALVVDYQNNSRRSARDLGYRLQPLREAFGSMRARDVNGARIAEYIKERLAEGYANASINRELAALKRAFSIAIHQDRLSGAPYIKMLAESMPRQGFIRAGDLEGLVHHLPADLRDYTRFAYQLGARKDAIAELTWADIDRERQEITFVAAHEKNRQSRTISYAGVRELFEIIERRWAARIPITPLVFHRNGGKKIKRFTKSWKRACAAAGQAGLLFHDLRRSAIRNMTAAGVDQVVAMRVSGHKTASVFQRYRIVDVNDTAAALAKTAAALRHEPASNVHVLRAAQTGGR